MKSPHKTRTITLRGPAMGKPRMTRRDIWKKRDCVVRYRSFADALRLAARAAGGVPEASQVVALNWTAYFAPPPSWSKRKREAAIGELHRSKPDRDNIDKAILDSLFKEDSGIASGYICKVWDWEPRLEIQIEYIPAGNGTASTAIGTRGRQRTRHDNQQ